MCLISILPHGLYTLSLHDALPILAMNPRVTVQPSACGPGSPVMCGPKLKVTCVPWKKFANTTASIAVVASGSVQSSGATPRSEEHTSELQSPCNLVCRLLLDKKKK